ncbi:MULTISPECIES: NUDIX hydrolase [Sphingobacterium]|jgi:8-oxo-dGTP diphosphatase|uniref:NUDIX hydrolase n=1 Tax=Sphingobacterium multivorum TaxID=28454 RepID=A0A654D6R6_SPHMU|nr:MULTISPECIES: NUDIX domain-containing protein [Sphingobacterium]HAE67777.1 NUDIX hydrolase [Sphingobacterium sp.]OFV10156.1 NUDIX hydrolase [Sphingobacterium sp. HMSC13C05]QQT45139.1 NUDIX hydrolase [Sphingobacterium multivorum]SUJ21333.1 Bifunctional NMN adenylyltransferase/Nudix hydrolase [Sphingobacterium multivorum]VXD01014.1 NUDIX hydrolase [Sphingobacterium multivorum]
MTASEKKYTYDYPRPAVTVDCVIFGFDKNQLKVLLTKRAIEPFLGKWAFPGGFIQEDENADDCAIRKLQEEAGLKDIFLEQLYTFSNLARDPRGRVISIAYYALVRPDAYTLEAGVDIDAVQWFGIDEKLDLAFDHKQILNTAIQRLRGKIRYQPIGFELLPKQFTLPDLHNLYETVLQRSIDRGNFRKKILSMGLLIDHSDKQKDRRARAAKIYSFDRVKYKELTESGFYFEV